MSSSELVLPNREPSPPRNPELEKRIQKLKLQQQNKEYNDMVKNLDYRNFSGGSEIASIRREVRDMNKQIITGLQYLMSIIGTFFGVFFGVGLAIQDHGIRVLFAILSTVAVGIAEIYFIIRDDMKAEKLKNDKNDVDVIKTKTIVSLHSNVKPELKVKQC